MVEKRTLNIPSYAAPAPGAASNFRRRREQRQQAPRQQRARKAAGHERAAREDMRAARQGDPIAALKLDVNRASEQYLQSLAKSGILGPAETRKTRRQKLSDLHQAYASMMILQCLQPLQRGISAESVLSVVGMGSAMWMLSPNFRTQVGSFAEQMAEAIGNELDRREARTQKMLRQGETARERLSRQLDRTGLGRESLSKKWRTRLERIEYAERGYRDPFTVRSAALTEVGLAEAAYRDMRMPGADVEAIRNRYQESLSTLYELAETDGLDRSQISDQMRVVVGQCLDRDPSLAQVFAELGHGQYAKSAPREVTIAGTTQKVTAWTGDYEEAFDGRKITRGSFSLREPMDPAEHRARMARTISGEIFGARTASELDEVLTQYAVCSMLTGDHPEYLDEFADPAIELRVARSRAMFGSMADDGFDREDQRFAYTAAYVDALQLAAQSNPDLVQEWAEQYGEDWKRTVKSTMQYYGDAGEQARARREQGSYNAGEAAPFDEGEESVRFTAGADGVQDRHTPAPGSEDDVVDAEFVEDQLGG